MPVFVINTTSSIRNRMVMRVSEAATAPGGADPAVLCGTTGEEPVPDTLQR